MWYQRILITAKIFLLFINKYFIYRNIANIEKMTCSFMMILRCIVMIFASQKMIFPGKRGDLSQTKKNIAFNCRWVFHVRQFILQVL